MGNREVLGVATESGGSFRVSGFKFLNVQSGKAAFRPRMTNRSY